LLTTIIHAVISIFAVMNPLGNIPIFLSLTEGETQKEQRRIARKCILTAFIILAIFIVLGHIIFQPYPYFWDCLQFNAG